MLRLRRQDFLAPGSPVNELSELGQRDERDRAEQADTPLGFVSEMLSIFSVIVGIALLLTGIGLLILANAVFGKARPVTETSSSARTPDAAPG